ncbi:hypothetical protein JCM18897A_53330 [Streptomyces sp. JCM 18897]
MVNALRCAHPALREPHRNAIAAAAVGLLPAGEHLGPGRRTRPGPFRAADEPHLGVSGGGSAQRFLAQRLGRRGTATRVSAHPDALQVQRPAQPFGQPAPSRRPLEDTPTQPVRRLRTPFKPVRRLRTPFKPVQRLRTPFKPVQRLRTIFQARPASEDTLQARPASEDTLQARPAFEDISKGGGHPTAPPPKKSPAGVTP